MQTVFSADEMSRGVLWSWIFS